MTTSALGFTRLRAQRPEQRRYSAALEAMAKARRGKVDRILADIASDYADGFDSVVDKRGLTERERMRLLDKL